MAEISLKEYQDKLEALLRANQVDETIHHCRHILQYFPRSASTYRYLGRALMAAQNLEEAAEVFRRVLSVFPDDAATHTNLGIICNQLGRYDEAIWHLERAYEQDTSSAELQDALRELYREHRRVDHARLQLTAGAVARQYVRNGLYGEAVETLRQALAANPRQADLHLLLARTLWDSDMKVEAAEAALDTLEILPDCLEANRIIARFWLDEGRPSDAQRYVSRMEAVDPYAAYRLAQGSEPPENAFALLELDYGRVVERRLATEEPDWLGNLSVPVAETEAPAPADTSESDLPDWLRGDEEAAAPAADLDELFGSFEDVLTEPEPAFDDELPDLDDLPEPTGQRTGFTGLLAALDRDQQPDEPPQDEQPLDWLAAASEKPEATAEPGMWFETPETEQDIPAPAEPISSEARPHPKDDPLAWMHGSGIELIDEEEQPAADWTPDDGEMVYQNPDEVNPLGWLSGSGIELVDDDAAQTPASQPPARATADDDPLAWLEDSSLKMPQEPDTTSAWDMFAPADSAEAAPAAQLSPDDEAALDWLSDESLLDEMLDIESLAGAQPVPTTDESPDQPDDQPLSAGWPGPTELLPRSDLPEDIALSPAETDDGTFMATESDWQNEMPNNDQQLPDWLEPESNEPESPQDMFEWLDETPSDEPSATAGDEQSLDWMAEEPAETGPVPADVPEWLSAVEPGDTGAEFEWLSEVPEEPEQPAAAQMPDWLAGAAQTSPLRAPEGFGDEETGPGEWAAAEVEPDWLAQLSGSTEPAEPEPESPGGTFDWVSGIGTGEQSEAEPAAEPDWLTDTARASSLFGDEGPGDEEAVSGWAGSEAEPDWLAELASGAEPASAEQPTSEPADDSFEWTAEEEVEAEPATEMPEWLAAAAPADEEFAGEEVEAEPATEMPEWLSMAAPADEEFAGEEAEAEPATEMPEWLSAAAPADEESAGEEAEAEPALEMPEWLAAAAPADEEFAEAEPATEMPEWLAAAAPADEEFVEEEIAVEDTFAWEAHEETEQTDVPDWMAAAALALEAEPESAIEDTGEQGESFEWAAAPEAGDDLTLIEGVGPVYADALTAAGIDTYERLAYASQADIVEALGVAGVEIMPDVSTWSQQAELAAQGAWDDLEALQDRLVGGREPAVAEEEPADTAQLGWPEEMPVEPVETWDMEADTGEAIPLAERDPGATTILGDDTQEWNFETDQVMQAADVPEWLQAVAPVDEAAEAERLEPTDAVESDYEFEAVRSEFGWLDEAAASSTPSAAAEEALLAGEDLSEAASVSEAAPVDFDTFDFGEETAPDADEDAELERLHAAGHRPPPADNAPEWLNNMVPGLELDYAAEEDQPVESAYLAGDEEPAAARGDFDWLNRIVDEETGSMPALSEAAVAEAAVSGPRQPRFVFTRPPAWLRRFSAPSESTVPDEDIDEDFELPDWLK